MVPEPVDKACANLEFNEPRTTQVYARAETRATPPFPTAVGTLTAPDDKSVLLVFCKNNRREFSLAEKCLNLTSRRTNEDSSIAAQCMSAKVHPSSWKQSGFARGVARFEAGAPHLRLPLARLLQLLMILQSERFPNVRRLAEVCGVSRARSTAT